MTMPPLESAAQSDANERAEERDRWRDRVRLTLGVVALLLLGLLVYVVDKADRDKGAIEASAGTLAEQVLSTCLKGGEAARQLMAIGACGNAREISRDPVQASPQPAPVFDPDAVRREVAIYLENNPPADGRPPTTAEVDAAVTRVCAAIDCSGPPGKSGEAGADGADGEDQPPPTDEELVAAVATYCGANNGCRPTEAEVVAAVEAYCAAPGERCRGLPGQPGATAPPPESYTRTETSTTPLGPVTTVWDCARTTPPEDDTPDYECVERT